MTAMEKPGRADQQGSIINIDRAARVLAVSSLLFLMMMQAPMEAPSFSIAASIGLVAICFSILNVHNRIWATFVPACGLFAMLFAKAAVPLVVESAQAMHANVDGVIALLLLSQTCRNQFRFAGMVALSTALCLTLFLWLSLSFGLDFLGHPVGATVALACMALCFCVATRFAERGWVCVLLETGRVGRRMRIQCIAAILGPWAFGIIQFRGLGMIERELAIEQLMIGCVIIGLVSFVCWSSRRNRLEFAEQESYLRRLRSKAHTDGLTRLPNRAGIEEGVKQAWNMFQRDGTDTAIILFDLDNFKSINDRLGHAAGDTVLKAIKGAVEPVLRADDLVGRWGGEEFLCLLPGVKLQKVQQLSERLRAAIEGLSTQLSRELGQDCAISASFGVALFSLADGGPEDAIKRADRGLYQSKNAGRNRVSIVGSLSLLAHSA